MSGKLGVRSEVLRVKNYEFRVKNNTLFIRSTLVLAIFLCCLSSLFAQNENSGTRGFAFMKINYSARAMGMGNAFTGLSNDADAVFFNIAGLAQTNEKQLKTTYMNYMEGMQGGSLVYATDYNGWKLAPFAQFMSSGDIDKTEYNDGVITKIGTFGTSDILAGVGFAKTINEALDFGFTVKYYYQQLDTDKATAIAGDIGIIHHTQNKNLKIGASLKNIGTQLTYFSESNYKEKLPSTFNAGATLNIADMFFFSVDACFPFDFEYSYFIDDDYFWRLGVEYNYNTKFSLRAGYDTRASDYLSDGDMDFMSGFSYGGGFRLPNNYNVDYGISFMGGLGLVHQVSVGYRF